MKESIGCFHTGTKSHIVSCAVDYITIIMVFFSIRWILLNFKRELTVKGASRLWEVLWHTFYLKCSSVTDARVTVVRICDYSDKGHTDTSIII